MDWRVPGNGGGGDDSAFDGDCDMAYGLLLADAQWGSTGDIDYAAELTTVLAGILRSRRSGRSSRPAAARRLGRPRR